MMVGNLVEVCKEEGRVVWEVSKRGRQMEHVLEFKYLGFVLNQLDVDEAECCGKWG